MRPNSKESGKIISAIFQSSKSYDYRALIHLRLIPHARNRDIIENKMHVDLRQNQPCTPRSDIGAFLACLCASSAADLNCSDVRFLSSFLQPTKADLRFLISLICGEKFGEIVKVLPANRLLPHDSTKGLPGVAKSSN